MLHLRPCLDHRRRRSFWCPAVIPVNIVDDQLLTKKTPSQTATPLIESTSAYTDNDVSTAGTHRRHWDIVRNSARYLQPRRLGRRKSIAGCRHHICESQAEHRLLFGRGTTKHPTRMLQSIRQAEGTYMRGG